MCYYDHYSNTSQFYAVSYLQCVIPKIKEEFLHVLNCTVKSRPNVNNIGARTLRLYRVMLKYWIHFSQSPRASIFTNKPPKIYHSHDRKEQTILNWSCTFYWSTRWYIFWRKKIRCLSADQKVTTHRRTNESTISAKRRTVRNAC